MQDGSVKKRAEFLKKSFTDAKNFQDYKINFEVL